VSDAYKNAGVNVEAGYRAVDKIKAHARRTARPEALGGIGAFGAAFDLTQLNITDPVLVTGTDGVGTKLLLAFQMDRHDTIGIDAVAMCVNDIVTQGAEPLFFLDYIACGKLLPENIEQIVKGIADGCEQAGCALIGGETAEMPGMYDSNEYDVAGFVVGAVSKSKRITGEGIADGDVLIGLSSNGIHSNGFSLVRKIVDESGMSLRDVFEPAGKPLGDVLLTPTRIYVKPILEILKTMDIKGMAHITGGGFIENIPRMLPEGLGASIKKGSWPVPSIFRFLQEEGGLSEEDLFSTFNMGIGMVLAVDKDNADQVLRHLIELGEKAYKIGEVVTGGGLQL
jgi:phosphoribosylformylglycinamidine cyclo-ligase